MIRRSHRGMRCGHGRRREAARATCPETGSTRSSILNTKRGLVRLAEATERIGRGKAHKPCECVIEKELRRRSAIEPVTGRMRSDGRLGRTCLKGRHGDQADAVLTVAGYNFRLIHAPWFDQAPKWLLNGRQITHANACMILR